MPVCHAQLLRRHSLELSLQRVCTAVGILLFLLGPHFFSNNMLPKTTSWMEHINQYVCPFLVSYRSSARCISTVDYYRSRHRVVGLHPTHFCIGTTNRAVCVSCVLQNIYEVWTDTAVVVPGSELGVSLELYL